MSDITANDGLLRSYPPKPSLQIGRNKVLIAIGCIGLVLGLSFAFRGGPRKPKNAEISSQVAHPGYSVSNLPSTYAELPVPTPIREPVARVERRISSDSKLEALLTKMLEEKIQRGKSAQKASVNFQNLNLPKETHDSQNSSPYESIPGSPSENPSNPRDDDNRQDEKNEYLERKRDTDVALTSRVLPLRSPYQVMAGTLIPGLLLSGLNSDLPGQIVGQVSQNVFDTKSGAYLLIPQGSKVLGQYDSRVVYGQERVLVVWTRIIFPNGRSISLEGMPGVDLSGYAGLSDQVNNHWGRLITGVVFSSLLSAGSQVAQGRNYSSFDPSYDELATQGAARNLNQVGQMITRRNLNVQPTLEIMPGFRFNVLVHKDMILEPYKPD